ncbi:hypothetical protein AGMMS49982_18050 [Bacteroidia bacterium]|nr:hypothetical protein AGMMS49982_18050 [Bacteroidia bacterium]
MKTIEFLSSLDDCNQNRIRVRLLTNNGDLTDNMTHKEKVTRNIGLTFDFVNYLLDNESEIDKLPDNFKVEFKEKDFPKLPRNHPVYATIPEPEHRCPPLRVEAAWAYFQ